MRHDFILRLAWAILLALAAFFSAPLQGQITTIGHGYILTDETAGLEKKPATYNPAPLPRAKTIIGRGYLIATDTLLVSLAATNTKIFITKVYAFPYGNRYKYNDKDFFETLMEPGDSILWDICFFGGIKEAPNFLKIKVSDGRYGSTYETWDEKFFALLPIKDVTPQSYTFKSFFGRRPSPTHPADTIWVEKKPTLSDGEPFWISEPVFRSIQPATYSAPSRELYADELEQYVRKTIATSSSGPQAWWDIEIRQVTIDAGNQPGVYVILDDHGEERMRIKLSENERISIQAPFSGELGGVAKLTEITTCMGCPTPPAPER